MKKVLLLSAVFSSLASAQSTEERIRQMEEQIRTLQQELVKVLLSQPVNILPVVHALHIKFLHTSGEKLSPYLRLPEKAIAYSIAIKVGK